MSVLSLGLMAFVGRVSDVRLENLGVLQSG